MYILLIPEPAGMFLLGVSLLSLARFARIFLKKHRPTKTFLSDSVKKLQLRNGLKKALAMVQFEK
ncbi:MAG: hypothetical protein R6W88_07740 [Desulfobacterales bacterium]